MRAYNENYLNSTQNTLGNMLDIAVNDLNYDGDDFFWMFISSKVATSFSKGNPKYIAGKSAVEMIEEIINKVTGKNIEVKYGRRIDKSPEYWAGYVLCYYQWFVAKDFKKIYEGIKIKDLINLYPTYHEADITKFVDWADQKLKADKITYLKKLRKAAGLSQSELSNLSEVPLRTIQMYEQKHKDINKAQAYTLQKIAIVLGCNIEDLLE